MSTGPERTGPATPDPATPPSSIPRQPTPPAEAPAVGPSMAAFGGTESCPNCGARMAGDQRYCLACGQRRGEPRLPFMDAVAFMESAGATGAAAPPPPPPRGERAPSRMNANAALIAGVATLVLAIGVGFLIGRTGHDNGAPAAAGGGGVKVVQLGTPVASEETAATSAEPATGTTKTKSSGGKKSKASKEAAASPKATKKSKENSEVGAHGASKATEEVLHTEGDVKLAEPEQQVGGTCTKGTAGCGETGKFEGNFFGE